MELAILKLKEKTSLAPEIRENIQQLHDELLYSGDETTIRFLKHILDYNHLSHPIKERENQQARIHNQNWRVRLKGLLAIKGLKLTNKRIINREKQKEYGLKKAMSYHIVEWI